MSTYYANVCGDCVVISGPVDSTVVTYINGSNPVTTSLPYTFKGLPVGCHTVSVTLVGYTDGNSTTEPTFQFPVKIVKTGFLSWGMFSNAFDSGSMVLLVLLTIIIIILLISKFTDERKICVVYE